MCVAQISQFNLLCDTLLIQWRIHDFTDGGTNLNLGPIITARQRSCGKVMFLHLFVCMKLKKKIDRDPPMLTQHGLSIPQQGVTFYSLSSSNALV